MVATDAAGVFANVDVVDLAIHVDQNCRVAVWADILDHPQMSFCEAFQQTYVVSGVVVSAFYFDHQLSFAASLKWVAEMDLVRHCFSDRVWQCAR